MIILWILNRNIIKLRWIPRFHIRSFSPRVRSEHVSHNFPTQDNFTIVPEFTVTSTNPTIDSARVCYRNNMWYTMNLVGGIWGSRISYSTLSSSIAVIGQPFTYLIWDENGDSTSVGPAYLFRVIEAVPVLLSPMNYDTVSSFPVLTWQSFSSNFPVTCQATVSNGDEAVWSSPVLPSTQLTVTVTDSLPNRDYYWTLTVLDSFQNFSRSKEGNFRVIGGTSL